MYMEKYHKPENVDLRFLILTIIMCVHVVHVCKYSIIINEFESVFKQQNMLTSRLGLCVRIYVLLSEYWASAY